MDPAGEAARLARRASALAGPPCQWKSQEHVAVAQMGYDQKPCYDAQAHGDELQTVTSWATTHTGRSFKPSARVDSNVPCTCDVVPVRAMWS